MAINKLKSGLILHRRKKRMIQEPEFIKGYPILRKYKYLGIYIDETLSFKPHLEYVKTKMQGGIKMMKIFAWKRMPKWRQTYIWGVYVLPHLRYGALIYLHDEKENHLAAKKSTFL